MSQREILKEKIDNASDSAIEYFIAIIDGIMAVDVPNAETIAAMNELEKGDGEHFSGSIEELHELLLSD